MTDPTAARAAVEPLSGQGQAPQFRILGIAASGMSAERQRLETIAMNIANAETTRTEGGGPYRRRVVELTPGHAMFASLVEPLAPRRDGSTATMPDGVGDVRRDPLGVSVAAIVEDPTEGPRMYEPGHPDADADGYVRYPNVNVSGEMVDLMDARRLFEANATVFQAAKAMLRRAMDI